MVNTLFSICQVVKFSLTCGDCQITFKEVIAKRDLVYWQYCLLLAPKHIKKIYISYITGATRFPYYISGLALIPDRDTLCCVPGQDTLTQVYKWVLANLMHR